jgi:hypothetical protein
MPCFVPAGLLIVTFSIEYLITVLGTDPRQARGLILGKGQ